MAAQEQQRQRVVLVGGLRFNRGPERRNDLLPAASRTFCPPVVDQPPRGDRYQPRPRVGRQPFVAPLERSREQRLLDCVFTSVELPVPPKQRAEDLRRQIAQQVLHG